MTRNSTTPRRTKNHSALEISCGYKSVSGAIAADDIDLINGPFSTSHLAKDHAMLPNSCGMSITAFTTSAIFTQSGARNSAIHRVEYAQAVFVKFCNIYSANCLQTLLQLPDRTG
eukprot:gnl/MRDRNA2_/MRDRNA2_900675_c0_seq1.p1 gnl/MRDRNA2_/MRDRNA2_900675_c0~~gnl/MRDRNA2_/MRDRNA2_900675_c0_seq1.p1  ORF type:complete len:123 (-),score=1.73 gnl/MRDRNA2_/MRDRNA2_900675_c0_seq1:284-628(-)